MPKATKPVAVIILSPPRPEALDLCLASLYQQTFGDFEVLLADRSLDDRHDAVLELHKRHLGERLRHIHAPGEPVSNGRVLNAAIASTDAEYLVFFGGNCISHPGFIEAHVEKADYGFFAYGECLALDGALTAEVNAGTIADARMFDDKWLEVISPDWVKQHLQRGPLAMVREWLQRDTPGQRYWSSDSSSCFRADAEVINGYDMQVAEAQQQRDFANRLQNSGLEPLRTAVAGNVLRLQEADGAAPADLQGSAPTALAPAGDMRARSGLKELLAGIRKPAKIS